MTYPMSAPEQLPRFVSSVGPQFESPYELIWCKFPSFKFNKGSKVPVTYCNVRLAATKWTWHVFFTCALKELELCASTDRVLFRCTRGFRQCFIIFLQFSIPQLAFPILLPQNFPSLASLLVLPLPSCSPLASFGSAPSLAGTPRLFARLLTFFKVTLVFQALPWSSLHSICLWVNWSFLGFPITIKSSAYHMAMALCLR